LVSILHNPLETTKVPKLSAACGSETPTPPVADKGGVKEAGETSDASGRESARRLSQMEE
jgi:hypothetical protein